MSREQKRAHAAEAERLILDYNAKVYNILEAVEKVYYFKEEINRGHHVYQNPHCKKRVL